MLIRIYLSMSHSSTTGNDIGERWTEKAFNGFLINNISSIRSAVNDCEPVYYIQINVQKKLNIPQKDTN